MLTKAEKLWENDLEPEITTKSFCKYFLKLPDLILWPDFTSRFYADEI